MITGKIPTRIIEASFDNPRRCCTSALQTDFPSILSALKFCGRKQSVEGSHVKLSNP